MTKAAAHAKRRHIRVTRGVAGSFWASTSRVIQTSPGRSPFDPSIGNALYIALGSPPRLWQREPSSPSGHHGLRRVDVLEQQQHRLAACAAVQLLQVDVLLPLPRSHFVRTLSIPRGTGAAPPRAASGCQRTDGAVARGCQQGNPAARPGGDRGKGRLAGGGTSLNLFGGGEGRLAPESSPAYTRPLTVEWAW